MREEVELLEDHAYLRAGRGKLLALLGKRLALDQDLAGVDGLEAVYRAAQRGLAGPGRAYQHQHLTLLDLKIDVLQDVEVAKVLLYVPQLDRWGLDLRIFRHWMLLSSVWAARGYTGFSCERVTTLVPLLRATLTAHWLIA